MNESIIFGAVVASLVALFLAGAVVLVYLDQQTDIRIQAMIKAGTDPGKAVCSQRWDKTTCPLIMVAK